MELHKIKLSQQFAGGATHKIEFHGKNYDNFMATKFVYSMMTFNIIYDKFGRRGSSSSNKIKALVNETFSSDEKQQSFYEKFKNNNNNNPSEKNKDVISEIEDDYNIEKQNNYDIQNPKRSYKDAFIGSFNNMIDNNKITKDEILLILLYINQIRNNLFHGSKDIEHAIESKQNARLKLYSDIILTVNEIYIQDQDS